MLSHICAIFIATESASENHSAPRWTSLGPDRGGRVTTITGTPNEPYTFYAGTVGGGVIRTKNAGSSWSQIATKTFGSASVGDVAVAPSNPNVIYVGMGESTARHYMSTTGDGMYKTADGGKTWTFLGLRESRRIRSVLVHPDDENVLYVSSMGDPYTESRVRGVYKSTDGGATWEQVLFVSPTTSARDLAFDPRNPEIVYVSLWDNLRSPWYLGSGGPGSGIMRSTDGGESWDRIDDDLPRPLGNVGIAVSPVDGSRLYAIVEANEEEGGLYVSSDTGRNWRHVHNARQLWTRAWYYEHVVADPNIRDRVYVNNGDLWVSEDAGETFERIPTPHGDNHALWINPRQPNIMANGNDGGAAISLDGGKTWSDIYNQRTGQFYRVATDHSFPYYVMGAQQDWGTVAVRSRPDLGGQAGAIVYGVGGGEGGYIQADPFDHDLIYAGSEMGYLTRFDRRNGTTTIINPYPLFPEGRNPSELIYRFDVNAPLVASVHREGVIYHGSQYVLKSTDRGQTWKRISPDLTRNRMEEQGVGGGPITNERIDSHNTLRSMDESPVDSQILWVGSDDGLIYVTRDGGGTWNNVTPEGIEHGEVYMISASPHEKGGVYFAVTMHKMGDLRPKVFRTRDYGASWTSIAAGLPQELYARAIKPDPEVEGLLYCGTEQGLFVSFDDGESWKELSETLPTTSVTGIAVKGDDLVISTEGTGFWTMRGLFTLRQMFPEWKSGTRLFSPPPAYHVSGEVQGTLRWERSEYNPAYVDVALTAPDLLGTVTIDVLDQGGTVVRPLARIENGQSQPLGPRPIGPFNELQDHEPLPKIAPGVSRFEWNLRRETIVGVLEARDGRLTGARVPARTYSIRLNIGEHSRTIPLEVLWPPHQKPPSAEDVRQRERLLRRTEALFMEIGEAVMESARERAELERGNGEEAWRKAEELAAWEERLVSRKLEVGGMDRINFGGGLIFDVNVLHGFLDASTTPVPAQYPETLAELEERWRQELDVRP
jgi:photosystem II stability/assembly factor-like uncharacterized protein